MKTLILFDPSIGSLNVGDSIISDSIKEVVTSRFRDFFVCQLPTQTPVSRKIARRFQNAEVKLVLGSNLLQSHMGLQLGKSGLCLHSKRQWDTNSVNLKLVSGAILVGCGWQNYDRSIDRFTNHYWNKILSHEYIHSVRDDYTVEMLSKIGIDNVVNTGCPTIWGLSQSLCKSIPSGKSDNVVATITDYRADRLRDTFLLRTLLKNYRKVFLWLQGYGDYDYFNSFDDDIRKNVNLIPPNLTSYRDLLTSVPLDYIGTRLHGGLYALRHRIRSIIIGIDNRAIEMKDSGICVLPLSEIGQLERLIYTDIECKVKLREANIKRFLDQFGT